MVHHLLMYECDPTVVYDNNNLPDGVCDHIYANIGGCMGNIATGWAVGGDYVSLRNETSIHKKFCLNRYRSFQKLLDIQLEVILKLNTT
jgi:hypothetical protein